MYGPSTVRDDRSAQGFYEAACSLLVWIDLHHISNGGPDAKAIRSLGVGLAFSQASMTPSAIFSWRLQVNEKNPGLVLLLVSSQTSRNKNRTWPLLKPGESLASTRALPSSHGVWPMGP